MPKSEICVKKENVNTIRGKEIPSFPGMIDILHQSSFQSLETEPLQLPNDSNNNTAIFRCKITMEDGKVCTGTGDATPNNVPSPCRDAFIRFAETRAISRAISFACNVKSLDIESAQAISPEHNTYEVSTAVQESPSFKPISEKQQYRLSTIDSAESTAQSRYGKSIAQLSSQEAWTLINELSDK